MEENMKVTLSNGMVVEGSLAQIGELCSKLGVTPGMDSTKWYYSESKKQWLKITEMQTVHLRNTILKIYQKWVDKLHEVYNPQALVICLMDGPEDKQWQAMVRELNSRPE